MNTTNSSAKPYCVNIRLIFCNLHFFMMQSVIVLLFLVLKAALQWNDIMPWTFQTVLLFSLYLPLWACQWSSLQYCQYLDKKYHYLVSYFSSCLSCCSTLRRYYCALIKTCSCKQLKSLTGQMTYAVVLFYRDEWKRLKKEVWLWEDPTDMEPATSLRL